jgi:hypothetical protein
LDAGADRGLLDTVTFAAFRPERVAGLLVEAFPTALAEVMVFVRALFAALMLLAVAGGRVFFDGAFTGWLLFVRDVPAAAFFFVFITFDIPDLFTGAREFYLAANNQLQVLQKQQYIAARATQKQTM